MTSRDLKVTVIQIYLDRKISKSVIESIGQTPCSLNINSFLQFLRRDHIHSADSAVAISCPSLRPSRSRIASKQLNVYCQLSSSLISQNKTLPVISPFPRNDGDCPVLYSLHRVGICSLESVDKLCNGDSHTLFPNHNKRQDLPTMESVPGTTEPTKAVFPFPAWKYSSSSGIIMPNM